MTSHKYTTKGIVLTIGAVVLGYFIITTLRKKNATPAATSYANASGPRQHDSTGNTESKERIVVSNLATKRGIKGW